MTLSEALESVELEPGRTYRCRVRGKTVEVRIVPDSESNGSSPASRARLLTKELCEEDIMLEAWCELSPPADLGELMAEPGERFIPDIPDIPRDDEEAA